ncbi:chymotrypsinogen B [Drosophila suzukii]|uniref:Chymotrypsinogen B n=1 Tax=Drosophila suzukii TaxID=28584 RepID=A0AB39ZP31_DROSZ
MAVFLAIFGIVFLWPGAMAQFLEPNCGLSGITPKIMHGQNAEHGANPWMAYIYKTNNESVTEFVCGGTLIHKEFVLTAAHCIVNDDILAVRLGEYFSQSRSSTSWDFAVTKAFRNKLYKQADHIHDIGILRVGPEVQFNAFIRPVCILTDPTKVPIVRTYRAAGWGKTEHEKTARVLQTLELNELDASDCYNAFWVRTTESQICAGHPIGDTCMGDSGGPLVHQATVDGQLRYVQFGIVSFGSTECRSPGVYTRVTSYIEWILKVVNNYSVHRRWNIQFRNEP